MDDTAREVSARDPYETYAREEAADRGLLRVSVVLAVVLHVAVLALPWPSSAPGDLAVPVTAAAPFRLQGVRFAPPQPPPEPLAPPVVEEPPDVDADSPAVDPPPPPRAAAELLVSAGPAGSLVPPQPLSTPAPEVPERLWRQGIGGVVLLTLVIDPYGRVVEVEREEGPEALADVAIRAVRRWTFLPATLDGQPLATAVSVRVSFPTPSAAPGSDEARGGPGQGGDPGFRRASFRVA